MSSFLLDTMVLSELGRPRPALTVTAFMQQNSLELLFVSEVVLAEIRFGIEISADPLKRKGLAAWLKNAVRPMFVGRVLTVTEDILVRWRLILQTARRQGYTFPEPDSLLAATAAHHGLTVVTRDVKPFEQAGAPVVNPWQRRA